MHYEVIVGDKNYRLDLERANSPESHWLCKLNGQEIALDVVQVGENLLSIVIGGRSFEVRREAAIQANGTDVEQVFVCGKLYQTSVRDARSLRSRRRRATGDAGPLKVRASMPGKVVRVLANKGDSIRIGHGILVIEAMKMQNEVRSPKDGTVKEMHAREGMNVNAGDVLVVLE